MFKTKIAFVVLWMTVMISVFVGQNQQIVNQERFREIYKRIYMDYYVQEKYDDAVSVLLRINPKKLDDSSRVDFYLLLGRVYVNLKEEQKAKKCFTNALMIQKNYIPPAGEWLPDEEQLFFATKDEFMVVLKKAEEKHKKSRLSKILQVIKNNGVKMAIGSGAILGSILLLSKKKKDKKAQPLPEPPSFPK